MTDSCLAVASILKARLSSRQTILDSTCFRVCDMDVARRMNEIWYAEASNWTLTALNELGAQSNTAEQTAALNKYKQFLMVMIAHVLSFGLVDFFCVADGCASSRIKSVPGHQRWVMLGSLHTLADADELHCRPKYDCRVLEPVDQLFVEPVFQEAFCGRVVWYAWCFVVSLCAETLGLSTRGIYDCEGKLAV